MSDDSVQTKEDATIGGGTPSPESDDEVVPIEEDVEGASPEATASEDLPPEQRIEALRREFDERAARQRDQLLRVAADFDNFRKRAVKQEIEAAERARGEVVKSFLTAADNLERALEHSEKAEDTTAIVEGLRLVIRQFQETLGGLGVERVPSAVGRAFDPAFHDAVSQLTTADAPAGTVVTELQPGYIIKGRLLRPAMVVVARPPAPPPAAAEEKPAPALGDDAPESSDDSAGSASGEGEAN